MAETLQLRGTLEGHSGWVTQIATNPKYPDIILSASRDKTLIVWKLTRDEQNYGVPQNVSMVMDISFQMLSCPLMDTLLCPDLGTKT